MNAIRNVLLIQPMHEKQETSERSSFHFPWGIAYVATYMQAAGFKVRFLDGHALQLPKEALASRINSYNADLVGISAFSTQYAAVRDLSAHIKSTMRVPVLVGGPIARYQADLVLKTTAVDVCVLGDGEKSGPEVLRKFDRLDEVNGIAFKRDGQIVRTPPETVQIPLDELIPPDFSLFDMGVYLHVKNAFAGRRGDGKTITFTTSRGCPYACNFCSKSSRQYRVMSPGKVYEMLAFLKKQFGIQEVSFGDELFLASKKRFAELGPLMSKLDLPWGAQARVNVIDEEFLGIVKRHGCIGLGYGIESGSQRILDNMNKRTTVAQIENAMINTRRHGLPVKVQLIFGYPGEDEGTVQETIDLFRRVDNPGRRFVVITPVPGSPLYDDCLADGRIQDEPAYLCAIEKSFGWGKVHVNFTKWPDEEIYPRKKAAEEAILHNYVNNSRLRRLRMRFLGHY